MPDSDTTRKILIIDSLANDNRAGSNPYSPVLAEFTSGDDEYLGFDLVMVASAEAGISSFRECRPDIVILAVDLPDQSGFDVYATLRKLSRNERYVGIIFVAAEATSELTASALNLGADDFCSKENLQTELTARIRSVLRFKRNTDALRRANKKLLQANERLAKLTITDQLSGLYNMRYFYKRLHEEFTRAYRYGKHLTVVMFDIDNFKRVNDTNDHLLGSYVLAELGKMVKEEIRTVDIGARYGGDEYIIMLPETEPTGGYNAAERIADRIRGTTFDNGSDKIKITISTGIATIGPGEEVLSTGTDLVRKADHFLFEAKESGRNRTMDRAHSTSGEKL